MSGVVGGGEGGLGVICGLHVDGGSFKRQRSQRNCKRSLHLNSCGDFSQVETLHKVYETQHQSKKQKKIKILRI